MYSNEYIKTYSMINIEKIINSLGKFISLMIPTMTILMIVIIVARYFLGIGLTGIQELVMYMHALVFLGCAGYVQYKDEHVRVDLIYRGSSDKYKSVINILGSLFFLIPFCLITYSTSFPYVERSWKILEGSPETSGLNAVFLLKTALIIFPLLLLIQAISIIYRNIKVIIEIKN